MARLRPDFQSGKLTDASISDTVQQLNSPGFANLPTVASPDTLVLSLDPLGIYGLPEIVTITDHASGATVITVERGTDGSVTFAAGVPGGPRAHNQNGVQEDWYASQTGQDYVHGNLDGLDVPGDHAWAALVDGSRPITGDQTFEAGINVTGASSFADTVTGPTAPAGTSNTQLATTQFVAEAVPPKNLQTFTASGTFTVPANVSVVEVFVVGGGGGGAVAPQQQDGTNLYSYPNGAGGGGGGVRRWIPVAVTPGQQITVTVGAGGAPGTPSVAPAQGGSSSFLNLTALGGGAGGAAGGATGGGGQMAQPYGGGYGPWLAGGSAGLQGGLGGYVTGGGGAGGGGAGGDGWSRYIGYTSNSSGASYVLKGPAGWGGPGIDGYGGGGGAGGTSGQGIDGGGSGTSTNGQPGAANTGGGGAGAAESAQSAVPVAYTAGAGGSGIVMVRW